MKNKFSDNILNRDNLPEHNQESTEKGNDTKMRETPTQTGIFRLVFNAQEFQEISAQLNAEKYSTKR